MPDNPTPVVHLSPEFLAEGTEAGLEKIRTRLLDLTSRNRLLNFRHTSASSIRVVGAEIGPVFRGLIDGDKFALSAMPEPPEYVGQKPSALDHAKAIGWPTSYDVDEVQGWDGTLPLPYGIC